MLAFAEGTNALGAVSSVTIIHDEHKDPNVSRRDLLPLEGDPGPTFVNINSEKVQIWDKNRPNDDHMECSLLIIHHHRPSTSSLLHEVAAV